MGIGGYNGAGGLASGARRDVAVGVQHGSIVGSGDTVDDGVWSESAFTHEQ